MTKVRRYHPLLLLLEILKLMKNSAFFAIFLFVLNFNSNSTFITYGRILFLVAISLTLITIICKWCTHKYKLDETAFHLYKGLVTKSNVTIPFTKIQNVNSHTSLFHRVFKMTSISFETGMTGENAAVKFEVISRAEVNRIKEHFRGALLKEEKSSSAELLQSEVSANRVVHFKPTKKELLRASFTSLSFLVFIPLLVSLYFKFNDLMNIEEKTKGVFLFIRDSSWIVALLIILLIVASVLFGITRMFLKYGKCEISSDENHIYITKGLVELTTFSISKTKVQAIEINQSIVKRLFGLAEVKLISASSNLGTEQMEVSSLYPFIPCKRAYEMISEILPSYEITKKMLHLPKKSFIVRMLKPSWFWMIATAVLFYFKPVVLDFDLAWWILSVALLVWVVILRILDYINTRYVLNNQFLQFKTGSLTTTLFVSKREKVVEVNVTQNLLQRLFGLASIGTINRAKPIQHSRITDVPSELAMIFQSWYLGRKNEVRFDRSSEEHESNRRIR